MDSSSHVMCVTAIPGSGKFGTHRGLLLHAREAGCLPVHRLTNFTTSAMSVRRALAQRSVHLRINPRPANLSESREIFRVLQRFGEINTYNYLRVGAPRHEARRRS